MTDPTLPDFVKPPVVETVLGVGFHDLPSLTATQIVRFWHQALASELPRDAQAAPYEMPVERFPPAPASSGVSLTLHNRPPPPRFALFG